VDTPSAAPLLLPRVAEPFIRRRGNCLFGFLLCDRHRELPQVAVGIEALEDTIAVGLVVGLSGDLTFMRFAVLIYRYEIVDRHADCDAQTTGAFLNPAFTSHVVDWHAIECFEDQVRASPVKNREDRVPVGTRNSP